MAWVELPGLYFDGLTEDSSVDSPVLVNRSPEPDETGVALDTNVYLEIVDVGVAGVDPLATQVYLDDVLAYDGSAVPTFQPGFDGPGSAAVLTADTLAITIDPTSDFESLATAVVHVVSDLVGGGSPLDESYEFVLLDQTPPILLAAEAIGPQSVRVEFNEAVLQENAEGSGDALNPANYTVTPIHDEDTPAVSVTVEAVSSVTGELVELTLDIPASPGVTYRVEARKVEDLFGNPIAGTGNSADFLGYTPFAPETRDWDLYSQLPEKNRREDVTHDLLRFVRCLQEMYGLVLTEIDQLPWQFDLDSATEIFVDTILQDLGNPFRTDLDLNAKRKLASVLVEVYRQKGTAIGIINAIRILLGIESRIVPYHEDTWEIGEGELGIDTILGPGSRWMLYAFDVESDRVLSSEERRRLREIVDVMKPAHTHFVHLLEPGMDEFIDHWEFGLSELGETSLLH